MKSEKVCFKKSTLVVVTVVAIVLSFVVLVNYANTEKLSSKTRASSTNSPMAKPTIVETRVKDQKDSKEIVSNCNYSVMKKITSNITLENRADIELNKYKELPCAPNFVCTNYSYSCGSPSINVWLHDIYGGPLLIHNSISSDNKINRLELQTNTPYTLQVFSNTYYSKTTCTINNSNCNQSIIAQNIPNTMFGKSKNDFSTGYSTCLFKTSTKTDKDRISNIIPLSCTISDEFNNTKKTIVINIPINVTGPDAPNVGTNSMESLGPNPYLPRLNEIIKTNNLKPEVRYATCKKYNFKYFERCGICGTNNSNVNDVCIENKPMWLDSQYGKYVNLTDCNSGGGTWYSGCGCATYDTPELKVCAPSSLKKDLESINSLIADSNTNHVDKYNYCALFGYQYYERCGKCGLVGSDINAICMLNKLTWIDPQYGKYTNALDCAKGYGSWYSGCGCAASGTPEEKVCATYPFGSTPQSLNDYFITRTYLNSTAKYTYCNVFDFQYYERCGKCEEKSLDPNIVCTTNYYSDDVSKKFTNLVDCNANKSSINNIVWWGNCNNCTKSGLTEEIACGKIN